MSANGFFSRLLGGQMMEDGSEAYYSGEEEVKPRGSGRKGEPEEGHRPLGHTIKRVAETIAELPAAVPRESAVLIVRRTLEAAGVKLSELDASTGAQESKLSSEVELARARQREVSEKTQEIVRSLEEEIRKAREACENIVIYEERKISRATATLKELRRVRAFFGLPGAEEEEDAGPDEQGTQQQQQGQQQGHKPFDLEHAQIFDTPLAQIFDPPRSSGGSREGPKGDGQPYSGRRVSRSNRRGREGEKNTMPVTKEEVGVEDKRPAVKDEIRVLKDAKQDNNCSVDGVTESPESPRRGVRADDTGHSMTLGRGAYTDNET
jgi:hypothetical protein